MSTSLNTHTYENLKRDIMTLALMPGEPVSAAKIAERYNVSRTPAREALVKLETEALVDIYPQVRSEISKIDEDRARQEWFIRITLELGVVDGFFDRVTDKDISLMRYYNSKMEKVAAKLDNSEKIFEYISCDNEFHSIAYHVSGQELAAEVIANTMTHYNRTRLLIDLQKKNKDRTLSGHNQLIRCIEKKDKEEYRKVLSMHITNYIKDLEDIRRLRPELFKAG